jgi:hypothetical protein
MRSQSCPGECEPAVLVGAGYRLLLLARCQAEHLWLGPAPLRACGLRQRLQSPGILLPVLGSPAQGVSR